MTVTKDNAISLLCWLKMAMNNSEPYDLDGYKIPTAGTLEYAKYNGLQWQSKALTELYVLLEEFERKHPHIMRECYASATPVEKEILGIA